MADYEQTSIEKSDDATGIPFFGVKVLSGNTISNLVCETFESGKEDVTETRLIDGESCRVILGKKICVPAVIAQRRVCNKRLIAQFCVPSDLEASIKQSIKDCIIAGISAGVLSSIIAGPEAFLPVLETSVKLCLITKGIQLGVDSLKLGLWVEQSCSDWRDV
jgi:hypothetical protein